MSIIKFSKFFEEAPAKDYVGSKDDDSQVKGYKPRSKGEEDFANAHKVEVHDYPVDVEGQFKGTVSGVRQPNNGEKVTQQGSSTVNQPTGGGDSKRTADKKQGDMKVVNPVKEETQLDELSPELKQRAFDKRTDQLAKDQDDYDRAKAKAGGFDKYDKKSKLSKASDKLDKNKMFKKHDLYKRSLGHHADLNKHGEVRGSDKSAGQKFQDYKDNGGRLSYNQYKARYLKQDFEVEGGLIEGNVMDGLKKIVDKKSAGTVKFENGKTLKVDMTTANAMLNLHKKINDKNKKSMEDKIEKSPDVFMKLMDLAFGGK